MISNKLREHLGRWGMRQIGTMDARQAEALIRCVAATLKTTSPGIGIAGGRTSAGWLSLRSAGAPRCVLTYVCHQEKASAVYTINQYVDSGIMTPKQTEILCSSVRDHRNILVSGSTGAGKTTLLNALIAEAVRQFPDERLVIIEDTDELQCSAINAVQFTQPMASA